MAHTFSEYLPHFAVTPRRRATDFGGQIQPLGAETPPIDGPAEAEARGRRQALAEARAEFETIRASDLAEFEARLAAREREFAESTADVLTDRLATGLAKIEEAVSGHVATALLRFLESAVRTRAVSELSETVAALLASAPGAARIRVTGPEAMVARLRERLAGKDSFVFAASESADVSVVIDDTVVETRIVAWEERLRAAAAPDETR